MASSSDEEPLLGDLLRQHGQPVEKGSQDSGMPDWMRTNTPTKAAPIAVDSEVDSDAADGPSSIPQPTQGAGTSNTAGTGQQGPAAAAAAAGGAAQSVVATVGGSSDRVVILPERLIRSKVLVELEPAPHQATELSGDAGAVGRLVASSSTGADGTFKIDLKGVLYQATVLPLAGTAIIINMGPTEAKIESVMNDFVRLKEEQSYVGMTTLEGNYGMEDFMADDEDNYQVGAAGEDAKDEKAAKKAAKKSSKAGGSSKAGTASKALKPAKAGVKKKAGAKKAAGKGGKSTTGRGKGGSGKSGMGSAVKAPKAGKTKAAAVGKPKSAAKKKEKDASDDDDDADEGDWDSDWSGE